MNQALEGIRIIDFSSSAAGPLVTKYLVFHGAEVIKIESMLRLDILRVMMPYKGGTGHPDHSGPFMNMNGGKLSLTLNLKKPEALDIARKLAAVSDIVLENFTPGVMRRLGLDYEALRKINPRLIMMSMSLQGQTGPRAAHAGWGVGLRGLAGFTHMTGWPDRGGVGPAPPYTDVVSPWFGVTAIMAALDFRRKTGRGQYIDLSQFEASLSFLAPTLLDYTVNKNVQRRMGNRSGRAAPHGAYRCKGEDRWCAIAVCTDKEWASFCTVIGRPEWTKDTRFADLPGRKQNEDILDRLVEEWTIKYTPEEIMVRLQAAGVPAGVVQNPEDLVDNDPQLKERGFFWPMEYPGLGTVRQAGLPFKLSKTPGKMKHAPRLGEHNEYVCSTLLGMSDEEFTRLVNEGVFE